MSFTKGVSFHHETNASSQPNITNNISINASNELKGNESIEQVKVEQSCEPSIKEVPNESSVPNENEFLKKVLAIYMNQKFYFSGKFLVLTPDELLELIQTLLPNKSVVITSNDIDDVNCCGFIKDVPIKKVDSIWVEDENQKQSFKYQYSNLVSLFDQYRISIKFVRLI